MNKKRLAEIASVVREWEARRLGIEVARFSATAQIMPKLPAVPKWIDLSSAKIAVSPDCSYQLVKACLRKAKHSLKVYIYNLSADYLLAELSAAKARGVSVRVMYDTHDSGKAEQEVLDNLGITHIAAPSTKPANYFSVCHQKFVVVDDSDLLIESANWATSSIPKRSVGDPYKIGNREWLAWVTSKSLAEWFDQLFEHDWRLAKEKRSFAEIVPPEEGVFALGTMAFSAIPSKEFDVASIKTPLKVFPVVSPNNYGEQILIQLKAATSSICVQQQYITAGDGVDDLLDVLEQKKKKGVTIRILVSPKFPDAWQHSIDTLTAANLVDRLRATNLKYVVHNHNKGLIIDSRFTVVSSTNWSENSIVRAREAGLLVDSVELAKYFKGVFDFEWRVGIAVSGVAKKFTVTSSADFM